MMPLNDFLPVKIGTALWRALRRMPPDYLVDKSHSYLDESVEQSDLLKLVVSATAENQELFDGLEHIDKARSLHSAEGAGLRQRLGVVGLTALEDAEDSWESQRALLWVFVQWSAGSMRDLKLAIAWYIGIERQNADWLVDYYPKLKVFKNMSPVWLDLTTGIPKSSKFELNALLVTFPWDLVNVWRGNSWKITHDGVGDDVWKVVNDSEDRVHGDHLLLDLRDLVQAFVGTEWKVLLWGYGSLMSAGEAEGEVWQSRPAATHRTTGPIEDHGDDYVYDHATHPNGPLNISRAQEIPSICRSIPENQDIELWDEKVGRRGFRAGVKPPEGVSLHP